MSLFSGAGFGEVETEPGRPLWYAGVDVRNAFFQHRLPAWVSSYFGLDPVTAGELGITSLDGGELRPEARLFPLVNVAPCGLELGPRAGAGGP